MSNAAPPNTLVIFGAKGDLTKRKLIPALFNLRTQGLLPDDFALVGFGRGDFTTEDYRDYAAQEVKGFLHEGVTEADWNWLIERTHFVAGAFDDDEAYARLGVLLERIHRDRGTGGNVMFYLATSPSFFLKVVCQLQAAGLTDETHGWRRVIVEKPFGRDLASAQELNADLREQLREDQIYRIDHYLGKETVQNILVLRFANGIFEPIWNRRYVDHVQITVAETLGVETRGGYYDKAGALRDMVPNHIFQLISLVAMEPPISFDADAVRDEQSKVIRAIKPMTPEEVIARAVRGQYGAGSAGGRDLEAYRNTPGVDPESATETFVAMKLLIDNWRWKDVPFYLRVGKAMPERRTEIAIKFRRPPFALFRDTEIGALNRNVLIIDVQPHEGIQLTFGAKIPGASMNIGTVDMDFSYADHFQRTPATGYEILLYEAMRGDQTLFQRADMVEAGWRVVNPILEVWQALKAHDFPNYAAGTWGPSKADELLEGDHHEWRIRS